ncbi:MAG: Holliday junction resolvase RuvX [Bacteriovoracaceae bacterium]
MSLKQYRNYQKFLQQTILALDYGTKFTGLSLYTPGRDPYPMPHSKIKFESNVQLMREMKKVVDEEMVTMFVLGIPRFTDGKESTWTKTVLAFAPLLKQTLSLPVYLQDETLSTFEAEERMKASPRYNFKVDYNQIDALSAAIILEDFLRSPIIEE